VAASSTPSQFSQSHVKRELANPSVAWLSLYARMNSGVKIHIAQSCKAGANRVELSGGTRRADTSETCNFIHGAAYEDGARLPCEPWRRPTAEEAQGLITTEISHDLANSVAIVRVPNDLSRDDCEIIRNVTPETLETALLRPLRRICELGEPLHCVGASANPANLKTVTINCDINRFNGLHVDNWDRIGLNLRHLATNRICINIGRGDRYFMFLPVSLMDIANFLAKEMGPDWETPRRYTEIGRQFMERFPDVPVVRCRLAPGEAYIAPTENLVHDGSSIGQSEIDEQFTIRGHIRPL
jgi:hypothetical protein